MYCIKCGAKLDENSKFCSTCGAEVEPEEKLVNNVDEDQTVRLNNQVFVGVDNNVERVMLQPPQMKKREKLLSNNQLIIIISLSLFLIVAIIFITLFLVKFGKTTSDDTIDNKTIGQKMEDEQIFNKKNDANEQKTDGINDDYTYAAVTVTPSPTPISTPSPTPVPQRSLAADVPVAEASVVGQNQDYIFENSNSEYLTENMLQNLSKEQLLYARNEIYARHGRKFKDPSIQAYFNEKSWYSPTYEAEEFDKISESVFNNYEKENLKLIVKVEEAKGYR